MNLQHDIIPVMVVGHLLGCGNADPNLKPGSDFDPFAEVETDIDSDDVDIFSICNGDCLFLEWTECTCAPEDPCGWAGNGQCDKACEELVEVTFDDGDDCEGPCDGECSLGWTECTCAPEDPCGWKGDGECDQGCLYFEIVEESFDDGEDCVGPCHGECDLGHTECTCAPEDPCGWQEDGYCDRACEIYELVPEMFDDTEDCQGTCDGECSIRVYTPCTCGPEDPCQWREDFYCDSACLEVEGVTEMFDDAEDCEG